MSRQVSCECFTLHEVSDGVFAAVDNRRISGSNAGFINLGNVSVIFDTFVNIDAARELSQKCRELTGRDAAYVINSHIHTDHIIGNSLFPKAAIISSPVVQAEVAKAKVEFEKEKDTYPVEIESIRSALATETDSVQITNMENSLLFLTNLNKPGIEFMVPNMTFDNELVIHGSDRSLYLKAFNAAHSKGDVIARVSDAPVCFMGDLLVKGTHPWLGSGDPESFIDVLKEILKGSEDCFIPGHGGIATKQDVVLMIQYINELIELVNHKASPDEKDYSVNDLSPAFQGLNSLCFAWNIRFLLGRKKSRTDQE